MEQYTQPPAEGTVPVPKPGLTRTPSDSKIAQLEDMLSKQHHEIAKLHREISRLKGDISDIVNSLRNRG